MTESKPLLLVTAPWEIQGKMFKTFKGIPVTKDTPFAEILFNPEGGHLVVSSIIKHIEPKLMVVLDDKGDRMKSKTPRVDRDTPYKEQRSLVEDFKIFYIVDPLEIEKFIRMFCINAGVAADENGEGSVVDFPFLSYILASNMLRQQMTQTASSEEAPAVNVPAGLSVVTE